ncbi:MAG: hypothetical protein KJO98_09350 [Rhodothermia bacterium]|nr:hypothetical protein [Rhodothermia bacterium]
MDLFDLLILSLFAIPALLRWIEQSRKGQREDGAVSSDEAHERGDTLRTEFERALEEIGLTLQGKPVPERSPQADRPRELRSDPTSSKAKGAFSREEQFERARRPEGSVAAAPFNELRKVEIASPYSKRQSTVSRKTKRIKRHLGNRDMTRDAILLSEILGPPVALRRGRM